MYPIKEFAMKIVELKDFRISGSSFVFKKNLFIIIKAKQFQVSMSLRKDHPEYHVKSATIGLTKINICALLF